MLLFQPQRYAYRTWWVFFLVFAGVTVAGAQDQILTLKAADFVLGARTEPPPDSAAWTSQALPDQWTHSRPNVTGSGWYRLRFDYTATDERIQAVYLPSLSMNAAVFLNGVRLGSGGSMEEPVARNWNRPLLFLIPPRVLRPGPNTLHVRLVSIPYSQSSLSGIYIGPEKVLRPVYDRLFFLRITLNQTITLIIAAIGLLMLSLWWRRRQDTMYAYFGASALVWSLHSTNLYLRDIPLSNVAWEIAVSASLPVFVALLMLSLLRFIEQRWRRFEYFLWLMLVAAPITLAVVPAAHFLLFAAALHLAALLATIVVSVVLIQVSWRKRDLDTALLSASIWIGFLFGVHDWLMHNQLLWYANVQELHDGDTHLVHYAAPLVFLMVGWIMTARFVRVLNAYEQLNVELEQRVAAKHAELAANYVRLHAVEGERAVLEERERLMADMHDGLGGQLITALRVVEADRAKQVDVAQLLRECLDEMRLVVNSLAADHLDLMSLLGDMRYRLEPRLTKAGIALDWQTHDIPALGNLMPRTALDIQRIVQEAITNIIKHAHARSIRVATGVTDAGARAFVRIADDGHGMEHQRVGRGLLNMRKRAERLGGTVEVESSGAGTVVTLWLPLTSTHVIAG